MATKLHWEQNQALLKKILIQKEKKNNSSTHAKIFHMFLWWVALGT